MAKAPLEIAHECAQECVSKAPVLILGSGASAAYGIPGMPALASHLSGLSGPVGDSADEESWKQFVRRVSTTDLESALNDIRPTEAVTQYIVLSTWDFLCPYDLVAFQKAITGKISCPLGKLYRHLFQSTAKEINIVTPNYDRLAEYAADLAGYYHYTGFSFGHIRHRASNSTHRIYHDREAARVVNVWKVHGSFDWFRDRDGIVIGLPLNEQRPHGLEPVIVTPGIEKYRITHDEPFLSVKQKADSCLQSANAYLCIGYGFNDSHVQTKLVERCRFYDAPLVLLTKGITTTAHQFLRSGKCKCYMAIEQGGHGSRMFTADYPDGVDLAAEPFWQLQQFLTMITT